MALHPAFDPWAVPGGYDPSGHVQGPTAMSWFPDLGPEWSLHLVLGDIAHTFGPAFEQSTAAVRPAE